MDIKDLKIGSIVYHGNVYHHRVPFKVVGIKEDEIELEGDFSGGTYDVVQRSWLPIKGTSFIYNYYYKANCRRQVKEVRNNADHLLNFDKTHLVAVINELLDMTLELTSDVEYNKCL